MNKNIIKSICDVNKDNIKNELLDEIYLAFIITHKPLDPDINILEVPYYFTGLSKIEIYRKIYLNDKSLFIELCVSLYDKYNSIKSILQLNNIFIPNILYNLIRTDKNKFLKIFDEIKNIINEITLDDYINNINITDHIVEIKKITELETNILTIREQDTINKS